VDRACADGVDEDGALAVDSALTADNSLVDGRIGALSWRGLGVDRGEDDGRLTIS
jgi:hypothetical protein